MLSIFCGYLKEFLAENEKNFLTLIDLKVNMYYNFV